MDTAQRESRSAWKDFLVRLKERGLAGAEFVVETIMPDQRAIGEVLPEAASAAPPGISRATRWITCPRKADDDKLQELRWLYDRRDHQEAQQDLAAWIGKGRASETRIGWKPISVRH
ncbi:MAG: transposase [Methylotetracoccus sp.]